jgi:hypothetical protein
MAREYAGPETKKPAGVSLAGGLLVESTRVA